MRTTVCAAVSIAMGLALAATAAVADPLTGTIQIPMSDGITLAADVYLPPGDGPFPTILEMTPYNRSLLGSGYVDDGYAIVNVDIRGTGGSTGWLCVF